MEELLSAVKWNFKGINKKYYILDLRLSYVNDFDKTKRYIETKIIRD
jgi:hypothetical protein